MEGRYTIPGWGRVGRMPFILYPPLWLPRKIDVYNLYFFTGPITPQRLARIYPQRDPNCQRCKIGTFWHMVWSCPKLRPYWEAVASKLTDRLTRVFCWAIWKTWMGIGIANYARLSHYTMLDGKFCWSENWRIPLLVPLGNAQWMWCCSYTGWLNRADSARGSLTKSGPPGWIPALTLNLL